MNCRLSYVSVTVLTLLCFEPGLAQPAATERAKAIAALEAAGGRIAYVNVAKSGPIMRVTFEMATDEGLRFLVPFPEADEIDITAGRLTDAGLAPLSKLPKLRRLNLHGAFGIGDAGMDHLKGLTELRELNLTHTTVTDAGLAKLAGLKKMTRLNLNFTRVGNGALDLVKGWPGLHELNLRGTGVTDAGLAKLKDAKRLRILHLSGAGITDAGIAHLSEAPSLLLLTLEKSSVTFEGVSRLRKASPKLRIMGMGY